MKLFLAILIAALVSTPLLADGQGQQFDLICKGRQREQNRDPLWRENQVLTFHFDLSDGSFCFDSCDHVFKLTRWDSHEIRYEFDGDKQRTFREPEFMPPEQTEFDRFTLTLSNMKLERRYDYVTCSACTAAGRHQTSFSGTCRREPFSGLSPRQD